MLIYYTSMDIDLVDQNYFRTLVFCNLAIALLFVLKVVSAWHTL